MGRKVSAAEKRAQAAEAEIAAIKAEQEAAERARLEEQGEFKTLAEQRAAEAEQLRIENEAFKKEKKERLDRITARNEELIKELPEKWQKFTFDKDPERAAVQIADLAKDAATQAPGNPGVFANGARPAPSARADSWDEELAGLKKRAADVQLGRVQTTDRGVQE
jgi:hypothetical protein